MAVFRDRTRLERAVTLNTNQFSASRHVSDPERLRDWSRRTVIGGLSVGAAALVFGPHIAARARATSPVNGSADADVIVIGGGLSGLTAAYRLTESTELSVLVLEANGRAGGRTVTLELPGWPGRITDGGGQWIGPGQDRVQQLARELGIGTFPTYVTGDSVYLYGGKRQTYSGPLPPISAAALADLTTIGLQLEAMAATVPVEAPWLAVNAREWDAVTFRQWLDANAHTDESKFIVRTLFLATNGEDPLHRVDGLDFSLLHALFEVRSRGGLQSMISTEGGAQDSRFIGGSQQISLRVAERLERRLRLSSPVRWIDQTGGGRVVVHGDTESFTASRVIVAMSPRDADHIQFSPGLPDARALLQKQVMVGTGTKVFTVYPTPFWRAKGLSGQAVSDLPVVPSTFDNSPPDGTPGVLLSFLGAAAAGVLPDRAERKAAILDGLAALFGDEAGNPTAYFEKDWGSEPYIAAYESPMPPGLTTRCTSAINDPIDRIHWAGTETSPRWEGYMDGAVRAGERAAREVAAALGVDPNRIPT